MDILNFISWIKGGRKVNSVDPNKTLLPVGLKDPKRDDAYLAGAITVTDLAKQLQGYKSYIVSMAQSGTNDPIVMVEFENSLGVTAEFYRDDIGIYTIIFDKPLFNSPFDYCVIQNPVGVDPDISTQYVVEARPIFFDAIGLSTFQNGVLADDCMNGTNEFIPNAILEIRIYDNPTIIN